MFVEIFVLLRSIGRGRVCVAVVIVRKGRAARGGMRMVRWYASRIYLLDNRHRTRDMDRMEQLRASSNRRISVSPRAARRDDSIFRAALSTRPLDTYIHPEKRIHTFVPVAFAQRCVRPP